MGEKSTICRICSLGIVETEQYCFLNTDNKLMLQYKLLNILPKIDLNITPDPIACNKCMIAIEEIYEFKQLCIQTEGIVRSLGKQTAIKDEFLVDNIKVEPSDLQIISDDCLKIDTDVPVCIEEPAITELYYCYNCDFSTNKKTILVQHLSHTNVKGQHTGKKQFKCSICDYCSNHLGNFNIHMRRHAGEKPFKCNVCSYGSITMSDLKQHMHKHTGEKPFQCNICDYCCITKSNLKIHMRMHTGEKPFKCKICDYCSSQVQHLKRHMCTHTGEKPFKCNICDYRCTTMRYLKWHMRKHTGEKPFKCNICDYCCTQLGNLKRHKKRRHSDNN